MNYNIEKNLKTSINKDDLIKLNALLTSNNLELCDKKHAFIIANFLKDNTNLYDEKTSWTSYFISLCLNKKFNTKNEFFPLLFSLSNQINEVTSNKDTDNTAIALAANKIITIIFIITQELNANNNDKYINQLTKILYSNVDNKNYDFIRNLYSNNYFTKYLEKRSVILEKLLASNNKTLKLEPNKYKEILDILASKDILQLDNISYSQIVESLIFGNKKQIFLYSNILKNNKLSKTKKYLVLKYYNHMIDRYLDKCSIDKIKTLLENKEENVDNIVYLDNVITMNDDDYLNYLNMIIASNNTNSYVKIIAASNITEEQKTIAIDLINQDKFNRNANDIKADYKDLVAKAAISPVLTSYPIEDYIRLLTQINYWCDTLQELYCSLKIDNRILFASIASGVVTMLERPNLYKDNIQRLYMTIDILLSIDFSEKLIKQLTLFAANEMTIYYTDEDYKKVLELIIELDKNNLSSPGVNLFTNTNIPYMRDKSLLFEIAKKANKKEIEETTKRLNEEGNYHTNITAIFNNVDPRVKEFIIGPTISKIKRW